MRLSRIRVSHGFGLAQGYLPVEQRTFVEEYLAEKKYLPPVEIQISK